MNWSRLHSSGNENVFKGSQLVSSILERHPQRFRSRAAALKFSRQLFRDGVIRGVFGADTFEDSVQLYTWNDKNGTTMTSYSPPKFRGYGGSSHESRRDQRNPDQTIVDDVRNKFSYRKGQVSSGGDFLKPVEDGFGSGSETRSSDKFLSPHFHQTAWTLQRASTASSESSVDGFPPTYNKPRDRSPGKSQYPAPVTLMSRDHDTIPEEAHEDHAMVVNGTGTNSIDLDGSSSIPRSTATDMSHLQDVDEAPARRWQENPYSDNEKQLIEQMKRMKKEHSHILRTYEDRINKLMVKMHELRSIAEMLENSSTKSSPYGVMPTKAGLLNLLGPKADQERKPPSAAQSGDTELPPPLPPRPGRGNRLYPNKPIILTQAKMKQLEWTRVILRDEGTEVLPSIWHTMMEPKVDSEEIERLFSTPEISQTDGATLYDDLIIRRGRARQQLFSVYDVERSRRIVMCMRCLRATLTDVVGIVSSLDVSQINHDSLAELIENVSTGKEVDKILYHVRKKGAGQLDHPEYLVFELSKVDHFKDRLEFIRFRYKMQWHLFEIDQQLREIHTACDEVTNSMALKNLLETLLAVGNYLNGGTEMGQADGFALDILNKLKDIQERDGKGTLLEFVLKTYCQLFESEVDIGCPTRFRLPEPSNMRHAAQVSFEAIQDTLSNLYADLRNVREKLLDPKVNKDAMRPMDSFRVTAENFFSAALEVIGEQEKVLQDTRDFFVKTATFFMMNPTDITPQHFFHIWAVFLHDCKYFWKLAHRRLAKERFELEFKYKGQMSACSLHGYGSFRAGVLNGMTSNPQSRDPTSVTASQQRHINSWMENLENARLPSKPTTSKARHDDNKSDQSQRSASPKPLTSTPPTSSDVHKPQPKAPVGTANSSPKAGPSPTAAHPAMAPNYENQSEYDRLVIKHPTTSSTVQPVMITSAQPVTNTSVTMSEAAIPRPSVIPTAESSSSSKKSQQFSLKAWLKREREQVRRGVEHETSAPPQYDSKHQSPARSFTKLKNSMISRFTGNSSSKKHDTNSRQKEQNTDPPKPPPKPERLKIDRDPSYDALRTNHSSYSSPHRVQDVPNIQERPDDYRRSQGSADQSDVDQPVPSLSPNSPYGVVDFSVLSPSDTINQSNVNATSSPKSDFNNNDKYGPNRAVVNPVNSAIDFSVSDSYGQSNYSRRGVRDVPDTPPTSQHLLDGSLLNSADSKRVRAQAVPVYKAKIINNYENQGKFESTNAIRQQAEPVKTKRDGYDMHARGNTNGGSQRLENGGNNYSHYSHNEQTLRKEPYETPVKNDAVSDYDSLLQKPPSGYRSSSANRYQDRRRQYGGNTNDNSSHVQRDPRLDNQRYLTPGNRAPMNAHSITSLIDKFDKQNNNEESPVIPVTSRHQPPQEAAPTKPLTMTSTPVAPRREFGNNSNSDEIDMSPPLPPRSDHSKSDKILLSPIDTTPSSDRYRSSDAAPPVPPSASRPQNYSSPYDKYSSPSQSHHQQSSYGSLSLYTSPPNNYDSPLAYRSPKNLSNNSSRYDSQLETAVDGYRAQLRRAANHASAFDRYSKPPQFYPRTSMNNNSGVHSPGGSTAVVKPTVVQQQENVSYMEI